MLASAEVDMRIIIVRHRRFGMYQIRHTALAAHRFEHIPKAMPLSAAMFC